MKTIRALAMCAVAMSMLSACVTTEKVAVTQVGDDNLTCGDIKLQNAKLDQVGQKAIDNKGVNTANVAAVLLFWPAAVGNYMDADTAEKLIARRRDRLAELYSAKHCRV